MVHDTALQDIREKAAMELTSFMVHKHYCENDVAAVTALFDRHFSWFGAADHEYAVGTQTVTSIFEQFAGRIPKCIISDEEYDVLRIAPDVYLCTGRMWIATDPSTNIFLRVHQRITTVFRFEGDVARCCHIHISNPYMEMGPEDIGFPTQMARQSYEYLQKNLAAQKLQIEAQNTRLHRLSFEDSLTGLYNRNKLNLDLDDYRGTCTSLGIVYFDLNGLKKVNDRLGHQVGDDLLCRAAHHIAQVFQHKAYRIGGDEFVAIDKELDEDQFQSAILVVCKNMESDGISCAVGHSWRASCCNLEEQFNEADMLMYQRKRQFYQRQWKKGKKRNRP
jgi:diguanylate cyclase (GGDEF)-like protein